MLLSEAISAIGHGWSPALVARSLLEAIRPSFRGLNKIKKGFIGWFNPTQGKVVETEMGKHQEAAAEYLGVDTKGYDNYNDVFRAERAAMDRMFKLGFVRIDRFNKREIALMCGEERGKLNESCAIILERMISVRETAERFTIEAGGTGRWTKITRKELTAAISAGVGVYDYVLDVLKHPGRDR